jgi:dihydrofolate reductase
LNAARRRLVYSVAMSLDGFIAGPDGEYDWILMDPDIDFAEFSARFDTLLMGRGTYEPMLAADQPAMPGMRAVVFSTTLSPDDHPDVTVVADDLVAEVEALRAEPGKDLWIFGGGKLFRSFLELGLVDAVEVALIPILLGEGIPFLPSPAPRTILSLSTHRVYETTGTVLLEYDVVREGS